MTPADAPAVLSASALRKAFVAEQKFCPVCAEGEHFKETGVVIAGGRIHICRRCRAYFLFPSVHVEYQESAWSAMRAQEWEADVQLARRHARRIVQWFEKQTGRPPRNVLEVGCGSGFMGQGFSDIGVEYAGLDVDKRSVLAARARGIDAHELPIEELPAAELGSRRFDLVLSSNALEHVSNPMRAFEAVKAVTGGLAVVIVPNPEGLLPAIKANPLALKLLQRAAGNKRVIAHTIDGHWHNLAYSLATLRYVAAAVGLQVRRLRTVGINDATFGFVQRNETLSYRLATSLLGALDLDSQLILVAS